LPPYIDHATIVICNVIVWSYYGEDQEKLFNEAHVISPFSSSLSSAVRQPRAQVDFRAVIAYAVIVSIYNVIE